MLAKPMLARRSVAVMVSGTGCMDALESDEKSRILAGRHVCQQVYANAKGMMAGSHAHHHPLPSSTSAWAQNAHSHAWDNQRLGYRLFDSQVEWLVVPSEGLGERIRSVLLLLSLNRFILALAAPATHAGLEFLAFFRCHLFQTMAMPTSMTAVPAEAAEQNLAQQQQTHRLHVADLFSADEQCRDQPVPQRHHHPAQCRDANHQQQPNLPATRFTAVHAHLTSPLQIKFVIDRLQSRAQVQHRITLARQQGIHTHTAFRRQLLEATPLQFVGDEYVALFHRQFG